MLGVMLIAIAAVSDQVARYSAGSVGADADFAVAILRIIGINIVLSGDNAVVIALACRALPRTQRLIGVVLGAGAAALLRILFTLAMQPLLDVPWLKLAGGVVLLWVAVKLLIGNAHDEEAIQSGANVWEALKIIAVADVVMSLDNVLAIAGAAAGDMHLIVIGLAISIPLVVFGSTLLLWLLAQLPILAWAGAALLGWIAGELIMTDPIAEPRLVASAALVGLSKLALMRAIEAALALLVVLVAWIIRRVREPRKAAKPAE